MASWRGLFRTAAHFLLQLPHLLNMTEPLSCRMWIHPPSFPQCRTFLLLIYKGLLSLNKLWERVKDREAWCTEVCRVPKSWTWLNDWTTTRRLYRYVISVTSKEIIRLKFSYLKIINILWFNILFLLEGLENSNFVNMKLFGTIVTATSPSFLYYAYWDVL